MKNILLLVHDDAGQESRLQVALDLGRALAGHISCVDVTVLPAMMADMYGAGTTQAVIAADERVNEAAHKKAIVDRLEREDVPWDWIDITSNLVSAVLNTATLSDLIVLNGKLSGFPDPDMHGIASKVVTHANAPIIAVPEEQKRLAMDRALIAWDGSASCAAALRAAVPLLGLATDVRLFSVEDKSIEVEVSEAAQYLSRYNIHASIETTGQKRGKDIAELITEAATAWQADYLVMGAYGHGRLREAFGGVTKTMLAENKLALVLAH